MTPDSPRETAKAAGDHAALRIQAGRDAPPSPEHVPPPAPAAQVDQESVGAKVPPGAKGVNLALQGGGSHGAFAWGVLDRLLEDRRIHIEGVSAASAGASNATVLAYGLTVGGKEGARKALGEFWELIAKKGASSPLQASWIDKALNNRTLSFSPSFVVFDFLSRMFSPYEINPLNYNPLRDTITSIVDFEVLRQRCAVKLFLSATNVRTGKIRIFRDREITPEVVLASGCLPFLFQTIEIDGEGYWDGGYMGNPALYPLIYSAQSRDVIIVHINPLHRDNIPKTAHEILDRVNEISFNSSLMREMRAVAYVTSLIDNGELDSKTHHRMLIHSIRNEDYMKSLSVWSKLYTERSFLHELREIGRETADRWLTENFDALNNRSTVDLKPLFL